MGGDPDDLLRECQQLRGGCRRSWFVSVEPTRTLRINPFYIDAYEVTQDAYASFLTDLGLYENACYGHDCLNLEESHLRQSGVGYWAPLLWADHPIYNVSWYGAAAFCAWRGGRLPTEAEWEMAASWDFERGTKTLYPWGDEFDGEATNFCDANCGFSQRDRDWDDGFAETSPIGSFAAGRSPVGAYDMGGNVWEWIADWFDPDYYSGPLRNNPQGPADGVSKVLRGGSWYDTGNFANALFRTGYDPAVDDDTVGFRCVVDVAPPRQGEPTAGPE